MSKVIQSWWYSTLLGKTIGIVKTDSGRFYIGPATGNDEDADEAYIKNLGTPFHPEQIK